MFTKTLREDPKDEVSVNAKLLERAGFIHKNSSGIYSYLPLGLAVLEKIENIIREEINSLGAEELLMPSLVEKKYWDSTGRWKVDAMYKISETKSGVFGLGWTHEEVVADIAKRFISSYKDLPKAVYQIQTKFRDEPRARSGLLRGREFLMKDLYSFHADAKDLDIFYEKVMRSYEKIAEKLRLEAIWAEAAGGEFTENITHEFQVLASAGEDTVLYCEKCFFARNKEIADKRPGDKCEKCQGAVKSSKAIEIGNVFKLGTKYSEPLHLRYKGKDGEAKHVLMGSYGIGPSRLMATVVEMHHDAKGIIWPDSVSPFKAHIILVYAGARKEAIEDAAEKLCEEMRLKDISFLLDDRENVSAGERFADADLIGIPRRIVISEKTIKADKFELKNRDEEKISLVSKNELLSQFINE